MGVAYLSRKSASACKRICADPAVENGSHFHWKSTGYRLYTSIQDEPEWQPNESPDVAIRAKNVNAFTKRCSKDLTTLQLLHN